MGGLDRLAIDPQGGRRRRVAGLDPHLRAERVVDALPHAGQAPQAEPGVHRLPRREVVRQQPPRLPGPEQVEHGVHHLAGVGRRPPALAGAGLDAREQRLDPLPLVVGQIGRVGLPCHARYDYPKSPNGFKTHS